MGLLLPNHQPIGGRGRPRVVSDDFRALLYIRVTALCLTTSNRGRLYSVNSATKLLAETGGLGYGVASPTQEEIDSQTVYLTHVHAKGLKEPIPVHTTYYTRSVDRIRTEYYAYKKALKNYPLLASTLENLARELAGLQRSPLRSVAPDGRYISPAENYAQIHFYATLRFFTQPSSPEPH